MQLWIKAEDDKYYPLPTLEHRAIIDSIWQLTEAQDFDSSAEHIATILKEYDEKIINLYGEPAMGDQKQMAEDYTTALVLENFYDEGEFGEDPTPIDTCPSCGCTEMLCGHNGPGCTSESQS